MGKKKLKPKNTRPGTPAMMPSDGMQARALTAETSHLERQPIVFAPGHMNRKARRGLLYRKKLATRELRENLRTSGVEHNLAGVTARILMSNPKRATEPASEPEVSGG